MTIPITTFEYDVAFSYASEDRHYVHDVVRRLIAEGVRVFYDQLEKADLWGSELSELFGDIFMRKARFAVAFISNSYINKPWPMHEGRNALARALVEHRAYFLPVRLDDAQLPGLRPTIGSIDGRSTSADELAELILRKLDKLPGVTDPGVIYVEPVVETPAEVRTELGDSKILDAIARGDDLYIALDLGGTKAYVSLMNQHAERFYDKKLPTESHDDADGLFHFIKTCIRAPLDVVHEISGMKEHEVRTRIKALSIAFPGPTDSENGLVLDAPNFRIKNFPLADKLKKTFETEVVLLENDVNLAVIGEAWRGAAKGYRNVVGIMIGTGIGGGIIIDGQLYRGRNKTAGEIGHMVLDLNSDKQCGCKQYGCFEALASRQSMARDLARKKENQGLSDENMWKHLDLGSNEIAKYYKIGDADAVAVVSAAAEICGKAVYSILNLLNPDIIVFNGGFVQQLGDIFLEPVLTEASKCMNAVYSSDESKVPIVIGTLPNPVLVGACKMAVDHFAPKREVGKDEIIASILGRLNDHDLSLLKSIYRYRKPMPISGHTEGNFYKDRLKGLRNGGLIRTDQDRSLSASEFIEITELGIIMVEQLI